MTATKLVYTKAIKDGRLKATDIQVGESIVGVLKDLVEYSGKNKDGKPFTATNLVMDVDGKNVEMRSAGNLNYLNKDIESGKYSLGFRTTFTRKENGTTKAGFSVTQFEITQDNSAPADVDNIETSLAARLKKIRAQGN